MPKRILIDIYQLHIAETGIGTYINELIDLLGKSPNEHFEYHFSPSLGKISKRKSWRKSRNIFFRAMMQLDYLLYKQIILPVRAILMNTDILFVPDYYAPMVKMKAKKIVVFHDTFFWEQPEHYGKLWGKYFKWIVRKGIDSSTKILAISNHTKGQIEHFIGRKNGIEVLHNTIPVQTNPDKGVLSLYDLKKDMYFLHVGVLEKRKNLPLLVRAFASFKKENSGDHKLVLVGKNAPGYRFNDYDAIIETIKAEELRDSVVLTGYLEDSFLSGLYRHALAYVFPSINEGFGYPILEAFNSEIPVIISNQGALQEIAKEAALVFEMTSIEQLISALKRVANDADLRNSLIKNGRFRLQDFAREDFKNKLEDILV